jgi:hypothetical protein
MSRLSILLLLLLGVVLVVGSVLLRIFTGGKHEIKTVDLVFLVIPLLLAALATGRLKGFDLFGVKADLSALWTAAAQTSIESQVGPTPPATVQDIVQVVEMASKGEINELSRLVERKTAALEFKLGAGNYYGPAIQTYLEALAGSATLRTLVVDYPDGTLFGTYNAAELIGYLRVAGGPGYAQFQQLLNRGDVAAQKTLSTWPGFVGAAQAVTPDTTKREALARLEQLNVDSLPVVNKESHFIGTIDRSKLTASLLLVVTDKLEGR